MNKLFTYVVVGLFALPIFALETQKHEVHEYDFRFDPIGVLVGAVKVDFDFAVNNEWTFGPELEYWKFHTSSNSTFTSDYKITAYAFGLRANWYPDGRFRDGIYVGPSINYAHVKVDTTDTIGAVTGEASAVLVSGLVGYGWFWPSFNMLLGGGATVGLGSTKVTVKDAQGNETSTSASLAGLAFEYSLGWTF